MQRVLLIIGFVLLMTHAEAQECKAFDELMRGGDAALKLKPPDYRKAIDKYTAAWRDCPAQSAKARAAMIKVFDEINLLKDKALIAEKTAKAEKDKALAAEKIAQEEKDKAQKLADGALLLLKRSLPAGETDVFAYYMRQADTAFVKGNYEDAIGFLQGAILLPEGMKNEKGINAKITKAKNCIDLLQKAGKMVFDLKLSEAVNFYTQLQQLNPTDPTAQYRIEAFKRSQTKDMLTDLKLITVKGGEFMMGSNDGYDSEKPVHKVILTDYQIATTEITNAQFACFLNEYQADTIKAGEYKGQQMIYEYKVRYDSISSKWQPQQSYENHPVVYVTWYGAYEFCRFYGLNLPTEAQWEYAARGGTVGTHHGVSLRTQYAGSNNIDSVAWYTENSNSTKQVATKAPNQLGLYDMSGNVYEWCLDWYKSDFYQDCANKPEPPLDPIYNPESSSYRVLRGGSWYSDAEYCRMAYRSGSAPVHYRSNYGSRVSLCLQF